MNFTTPVFALAPYATFCILLLVVCSTVYLRCQILSYAKKNLPQCFASFNLHEEQQDDTCSLALYRYISSHAFEQSNDPVFIALCTRYIRWGQLFILLFFAAVVDISVFNPLG